VNYPRPLHFLDENRPFPHTAAVKHFSLIPLAALCLIACGKASPIDGTWVIDASKLPAGAAETPQGKEIIRKFKAEFQKGGTCKLDIGDGKEYRGTFEVNGKTITIKDKEQTNTATINADGTITMPVGPMMLTLKRG
jgi:hypothetical protein